MARRSSTALVLVCAAVIAPAASPAAAQAAEPTTGKDALRQAERLSDGRGVRTGRELTPALGALTRRLDDLQGADRRRALRLLARPTQGEAREGEDAYTVPEAPPRCGAHFCIHYVPTTADAPPSTGYVDQMLAQFEHVYNVENNSFGWHPPVPDGTRGGDGRTDVYIKNIGGEGLYGYAASDPDQRGQRVAAYLVLDNDYAEEAFSRYANRLHPLQVTAAHEYNHVLQYAYDAAADTWVSEATATWMEDEVYDHVNDYVGYLARWTELTVMPLTQFDSNLAAKVYGDAVFCRYIAARFGREAIRRAWEVSIETDSFGPGTFDRALRERGSSFFDVFTAFAADTAEWRTSGAFEEGETFPDVRRQFDSAPLSPQQRASGAFDHTSYAIIALDAAGQNELTLGATARRGTASAVALVGLAPDGTAIVSLARLPSGGAGRTVLRNASGFRRVAAVLINADATHGAWDEDTRDWAWNADDRLITMAINDFTRPKVRSRSPRRNARRVARRARVKIAFSELVTGIDRRSVRLIGPNGRPVRGRIVVGRNERSVRLLPRRRLTAGRRYRIRIGSGVTDLAGNKLRASQRTWRFTTRR